MGRKKQARAAKAGATGRNGRPEQILDLDRYVPALITFIGNKLSRTATVIYQEFGANPITKTATYSLF